MPCQALSALTIIALLVGSSHADDQKHLISMEGIRESDKRSPSISYMLPQATNFMEDQATKYSNLRNDDIGYLLQLFENRGGEFSNEFETDRSARLSPGTMHFGKRSNPLGTMRFGKRQPYFELDQFGKRDAPLGTMRFGRRR